MIQLTRLNHGSTFFVNPDLVERVDTHVDTVVRLTSGSEFVVKETGDEIVQRIAEFRARVIALAAMLSDAARSDAHRTEAHRADVTAVAGEIAAPPRDHVGDEFGADHAVDPEPADDRAVDEVAATEPAAGATSPWAPAPPVVEAATSQEPGAPQP